MQRDAGLTITELAAGLGLISLLAIVAVPRFSSLVLDAKETGFQAVVHAYQSAVRMSHSSWIASGQPEDGEISLSGQPVILNAAGWPMLDAAISGQDTAASLYSTLMTSRLPGHWNSSENFDAQTAEYTYADKSFRYDASDGSVADTSP